jgi:hypothetical protein
VNQTCRVLASVAALLLAGSAGADGLALRFKGAAYLDDKDGPLSAPEGVACSDAQVVVADTGNGRLVRYALREGLPVTPSVMKLGELAQPAEAELDAKGTLYVLDRKARKIGKVGPEGSFAGWVEVSGVGDPKSVVPVAFKLDGAGGLVLVDAPSRRVLFVDGGGAVTRQLPLPRGQFTDVAADGGVVYLVDTTTSSLWAADKQAKEFKAVGKSLKDVLVFPSSFSMSRGMLVVGDQHGHGVVFVGSDGTFQGRQLDMGWNEGSVYYPSAICANAAGDVFVADRGNNRLQVFATKK